MQSFRKLRDYDKPLLEEHLLRVGGDDRVMRFMGGVSDAYIRDHCSQIGWPDTVVVGCFVDGRLRGAAEMWFDPAGEKPCELALTVEHDFQSRGIGTELLRRALVVARNRGARSLYLACLPENRKMQHILRKFGRIVTTRDPGMIESELALAGPSHFTMWQEFAGDGIAMMDTLVERMSFPAGRARVAA